MIQDFSSPGRPLGAKCSPLTAHGIFFFCKPTRAWVA